MTEVQSLPSKSPTSCFFGQFKPEACREGDSRKHSFQLKWSDSGTNTRVTDIFRNQGLEEIISLACFQPLFSIQDPVSFQCAFQEAGEEARNGIFSDFIMFQCNISLSFTSTILLVPQTSWILSYHETFAHASHFPWNAFPLIHVMPLLPSSIFFVKPVPILSQLHAPIEY